MYTKTYQSHNVAQRIVLKPNLQYGRRDISSSDARTSFDHSSNHKEDCDGGTYKESSRGEIDFTIQGLPHSAVQEHDHIRKEAVQKLIHQFETQPNKEKLQANLKQNHAFNPFAVEGNDLQHGKHEVFRDLRDHTRNTVPQLQDILDERHCFLNLRNMLATFRQNSNIRQ